VVVLFAKSFRPHPQPFPYSGRESPRTSHCSSQCGSILPLKGELEGVSKKNNHYFQPTKQLLKKNKFQIK